MCVDLVINHCRHFRHRASHVQHNVGIRFGLPSTLHCLADDAGEQLGIELVDQPRPLDILSLGLVADSTFKASARWHRVIYSNARVQFEVPPMNHNTHDKCDLASIMWNVDLPPVLASRAFLRNCA